MFSFYKVKWGREVLRENSKFNRLVTKELDTFVKGTVFSEITQQVKRNEYWLGYCCR